MSTCTKGRKRDAQLPRGSTKMSSSGQSRVMLVKVNASPPVCRDLAISCFGISNSIPYTTERQDLHPENDIHIHLAFQIAVAVADFLFNTHRYVFAIDFYEEILVLISLLASISELGSCYPCNEFEVYASGMAEELELTKRSLQSEHVQAKEVSGDRHSRPATSYAQEEAIGAAHVRKREISFYKTLGSTFYSLSLYMTSIWYYERAAEMIKATGNKLEEQRIYTSLAMVHNAASQFDDAIRLQEQALHLCQEIGDLKGELECYNNFGSLYSARGEYDFAIICYSKGLAVNDRMAEAMAHNNIGNVYHASGQYDKAIDHHEESLRIRNEIEDSKGRSITYNNLSCDFYLLGQYETAITYQEKALEIGEAIGATKQVAVSYNNLGCVYQAFGELQLSLENHEKGLKIRKEIGDSKGECRSYKEICRVHDALGHFRDSMKYHTKALRHEQAIINKRENVVSPALHGQWIGNQERELEIIEEIGHRDSERLILYKMTLSHTSRLNFHKATDHLADNIRSHECARLLLGDECKLSLDEQSVLAYKTFALMLISLGHYTDALLVLEQGRARGLVDLVLRKYGMQEVASQNFDNLSGLTSFFATQRENLLFMATLMDSICLWFIDRDGNLHFKSYFVTKDVLHDSLLNFFCTGSSHCFRGSANLVVQKVSQPLSSTQEDNLMALDGFLQFLSYPSAEAEQKSVPFLHQVIFGFADNLPHDDEIIFVPEGPMFQVPFAALQDTSRNYLAEKARVRLVPSITTLKIIQDSSPDYHSKTGALLVGDPENHLSRLPGARKEVQMIAELLGDPGLCLIGSEATKQEVLRRIQNVSLVHISAHGKMETGEIALAGDELTKAQDWILTMEDVAKVGIRAKLVVLSACHGAHGKIMTAEGVVGMARTFLGAGARSVLVSLWAIEDIATLAFMTSFYKFLFLHKLSASTALQQSMKEMRDSAEYNLIRDWAPFVLYGDDVTLDVNEICQCQLHFPWYR